MKVRYTKNGNVRITLTVTESEALKSLLNNSGSAVDALNFPDYGQFEEDEMAAPLWMALDKLGPRQ